MNIQKSIKDLHLKSTLGDLPLLEAQIDIDYRLTKLREILENNPLLPGVIITLNNQYFGFISRKTFYESLSKPFGLELFSKRPINFFYESIEHCDVLVLPSTMDIPTAVQNSLARTKDEFDAPIIVEFENKTLRILDSYHLILAHSQINLLAMQALKEANDAKTELLSIAAHDLKNPLNNIIALTKIAKSEIQADNPDLHELIDQIQFTSTNMFNLIIELLNTNVIEAGKIILKKQITDLSEIIGVIVYQSHTQVNAKEQKIEFISDKSLDYLVNADPMKIREAIENLVSNAVKYSPFAGIISIQLIKIVSKIRIVVNDSGPGLTEEDMQKIFGKFQRLSAQPTAGESSTGLGLYIAKQIVELHDGVIWAESTPGNGAAFFIELDAVEI